MRLDLLKRLLAIPSPSGKENAMVAFLVAHVRQDGGNIVTDSHNNVFIRKGKPGTVPCVAAHLDTVHPAGAAKIMQKDGRLFGVNEQGQPAGIGADDKAGVFVCLELLERFEDIAVILFAGEEIGCVGARQAPADWFKDVGYLIEFDCPGKGLVSYTAGSERLFANDGEFIRAAAPVLQAQGLTHWQRHPFTDVMAVRQRFPISCLNLSCGYYHWHQPEDFIEIDELAQAVQAGEALIEALGYRSYPFPIGAEDTAAPLFPVTGLQVNLPAPQPAAVNASPLNLEPLAAPDDMPSLWERYFPGDVPFFKLGLLDHLLRRPYHAIKLQGPFQLKQLAEDFRDRIYRSESHVDQNGKARLFRLLLRFDGDVFGYLEADDTFKIYAPTAEQAQAIAQRIRPYVKPPGTGKAFYYLISIDNGGANTEKVFIERQPVASEELALHYGEDFPAWEQQWLERLRQTSSGLTIFHGPPGCGKTYFLRAMANRLLDQAAIYVIPLSEVEMLSNPRFVSFWVDQTKRQKNKIKVVILEDAEELLLPRDLGSRDKVSNLLNIADGFLGDHLKIQVVATTNAAVRELDKAILRPGRLIGQREFRRLTRCEAQRLAQAKGLTLPDQADFSLAEVYNGGAENGEFNRERRVGFSSS